MLFRCIDKDRFDVATSKPEQAPRSKPRNAIVMTKHPMYECLQEPPAVNGEEIEWVKRPHCKIMKRQFTPFEKPGPRNFDYKTSPADLFEQMFEEAGELWRKNSNLKLIELAEAWNAAHPDKKPRKPVVISKSDKKAFVAALLHMGLSNKPEWKQYWSKTRLICDEFITGLKTTAQLSARRFRLIMNSCRLYDKKKAAEMGWSDPKSKNFDEHYRVYKAL